MVYFNQDLEQLADELRADIVYTVSNTGGHLSSSLGVVELSVALHHVFNAPEDKIIWDVGHQVKKDIISHFSLILSLSLSTFQFLMYHHFLYLMSEDNSDMKFAGIPT